MARWSCSMTMAGPILLSSRTARRAATTTPSISSCSGTIEMSNPPISERKAILKTLVSECDAVRYTDHVVGIGREFFDAGQTSRA